jgi:Bacterial membrane protein YfhO
MLRRLGPYLLLALLALVFFGDVVLHPTQVLYSDHSDLLAMHLPMKRFLVRSWHETGELPLWFPYSFGGTPFVHDVQVAMFYPPHWPLLLLPEEGVGAAVTWLVVLHVMVAGWCAFALARAQGLGTMAGLVTGIGYMFAGKWLLHVLAGGHTIMAPLAWLPLTALLLDSAVRRGSFVRATAAGAAFALIVLGTHPQITFYAGLFMALWSLGPALEAGGYFGPGRARSPSFLLGWLLCGAWTALVAAALSAVQLLPARESIAEATRGAGVAADEAGRVLPALLRLVGPTLDRPNWEYQGNFGLLWVMAAALAPALGPARVRYQAAVAALLVLFALGGGILFQRLPGFSLFQLPVRMLLVAALPVALLAGYTTQALLDRPAARGGRLVRIAAGTLAACALLILWPLANILGSGQRPTFHPYWIVLAVTLPVFFWLLAGRARVARSWAVLWVVLLTADVCALSFPLVAVRSEEEIYAPSACVRELARRRTEDESPWRVLDRGVPNFPSSAPLGVSLPPLGDVRLEPVLGYNTFDVRRTKQYLAFAAGSTEPVRPKESPFGYPILEPMLIDNKKLLDLLGVRYLLAPADPADRPLLLPNHKGPGEPGRCAEWQEVGRDESPAAYSFLQGGVVPLAPQVIYENRTAFPRAFIVSTSQPLPDERDVPAALTTANLREMVFLADRPEATTMTPADQFDRAHVVESRPNRVVVQTDDGPGGYLVLTDVWYPGWRCTVDGRATQLYRADYLFRGVELPPGAHEVVFIFEPASYRYGRIVSLAALMGVAAVLLRGWVGRRPRNQTTSPATTATDAEIATDPVVHGSGQ